MKRIQTIVEDIYTTIGKKDGWFTPSIASVLGTDISKTLRNSLGEERPAPTLRLSAMGPKCPRALWYSIHHPELAEKLPGYAEIKYSYGHILEALIITLAKASGHSVTGEQDELVVDGVKGHRDCVIDGAVVDVKSCSPIQFQKYKTRTALQDDSFGFLDQLDGYIVGSASDPLVTIKDRGYILAIDKVHGHVCLYEHFVREESIRERIAYYKRLVACEEAPRCECTTIPDGKSGNIRLDTKASYSPYKHICFPHLRTFLYAGKAPVFLSHVERKPNVLEVDRHGRVVYN